jgi:hypothetical protein
LENDPAIGYFSGYGSHDLKLGQDDASNIA